MAENLDNHLEPAQIDDFLAKRLKPDALLSFTAHLAHCSACQRAAYVASGLAAQGISMPFLPPEPHLDYEELEALAMSSADERSRAKLMAHVAVCAVCQAELADLSEFITDTADKVQKNVEHETAIQQQSANALKRPDAVPAFSKFLASLFLPCRPMLAFGLAAAAFGVAALMIVLYQPLAKAPMRVASRVATGPADVPPDVQAVLQSGKLDVPREALALGSPVATVRSLSSAEPTILGPNATFVAQDRPVFSWAAVAGARGYDVELTDDAGRSLGANGVSGTQWVPTAPLRRGAYYSWRVIAHLTDGTDVVAPDVPTLRARFGVIDSNSYRRWQTAHSRYATDLLTLGVLDARLGLVGDAVAGLTEAASGGPQAQTARRLLTFLQREQDPRG